jgi:hypothetical protein
MFATSINIWAQVRKFERFGACFCTCALIIWSVLLHLCYFFSFSLFFKGALRCFETKKTIRRQLSKLRRYIWKKIHAVVPYTTLALRHRLVWSLISMSCINKFIHWFLDNGIVPHLERTQPSSKMTLSEMSLNHRENIPIWECSRSKY